jgi:hypothetical protein
VAALVVKGEARCDDGAPPWSLRWKLSSSCMPFDCTFELKKAADDALLCASTAEHLRAAATWKSWS